METPSDRLHPGSLICDADKRLISYPSFQLGPAGLGTSQASGTVWDGIRAKIILFSQSRRSALGKGRRTSSPARTCLVPSLDRGDASARDGHGLAAEIRSTTLERGLSHDAVGLLKQRSAIFRRDPNFAKRPQSSICTNASGRAAAGRR